MTLLGIQIRSTMRHYDHIIKERTRPGSQRKNHAGFTLYFDKSYENTNKTMGDRHYGGTKQLLCKRCKGLSRNISRERCFQRFSKLGYTLDSQITQEWTIV